MTNRKPDSAWGMKLADLFPSLAVEPYLWCLHCLRVFSIGEWDRTEYCPAADCDGSPLDAWPWSELARFHGWPAVPIEGQVYDPYSEA